MTTYINATVILPDRLLERATVRIERGRFVQVDQHASADVDAIDLQGNYLAPGFIDLHIHGGDNADFMDLTDEAWQTVCRCHARHGTTRLTPTSTVATRGDYFRFLELCQSWMNRDTGGARILGGHLYGPLFLVEAKGCHPVADFLEPTDSALSAMLDYAGNGLVTFTIAPELDGALALIQQARDRGLLVTAGHTYATFSLMERAIEAGVRHADHLFCAMSDRARLRVEQPYPMRGGVMEAVLYFDEMTSELIADGVHLSADLMRLAYKVKGSDKLALVTDAMRAVDCPDGEYRFGSKEYGEPIRRRNNAGLTLDGNGLASGVMGMDHCLRTFINATNAPLWDAVRMASLTPARILGVDATFGSIEVGKVADVVLLDKELQVKDVYIADA